VKYSGHLTLMALPLQIREMFYVNKVLVIPPSYGMHTKYLLLSVIEDKIVIMERCIS
jgi:hypothetical protein